MYKIRVVTRAPSMASTVSGIPRPVPGAECICARTGPLENVLIRLTKKSVRQIFKDSSKTLREVPIGFYCDRTIGCDVLFVGFFSNGHCFIAAVHTKNASTPSAISSSPHFRAAPVCQKSHAQPNIVKTAGRGYNHI